MSTPIVLTTSFADFTNASSRRAFNLIGSNDCVVQFESGLTLGSSSGVRVQTPLPPAVVDSPLGATTALTLKGPTARTVVLDEPSGYLRYVVLAGTVTNCWVDVAPQPSVGPAGSASIPGGLGTVAAIAVTNQATLSGLAQTIDGVALNTAGMRVYLARQTTGSQQGMWVVQSGNWVRPSDWASGSVIPLGTQIYVAPGGIANFQTYGSTWYIDSTTGTGVVDTDTLTAYPEVVKGSVSLTSASPSTATVSNLWIKSTVATGISAVAVTNATTAANGVKAVLTAGAGTGSLALTGPNTVTDSISYTITNA